MATITLPKSDPIVFVLQHPSTRPGKQRGVSPQQSLHQISSENLKKNHAIRKIGISTIIIKKKENLNSKENKQSLY